MRRHFYKKYLILGLALLLCLSIPVTFIQKFRGAFFRLATPVWSMFSSRSSLAKNNIQQRLEAENYQLRTEIGKLRTLIEQNALMASVQKMLPTLIEQPRQYQDSCFLLGLNVHAVPAKVIYRDPSHWTSSLWINVGRKTNDFLNMQVVAKNSPVVLGRALVGVIDYVGESQSRVKLITDSGLHPAVRAVRGYPQNLILTDHIEAVLRALNFREDLNLSLLDKQQLNQHLTLLKKNLQQSLQGWHLAKGILQGASMPIWRTLGTNLKGIGFNYDFSDEEGPARDLRTGKPIDPQYGNQPIALLKINDLLVTTGMDGLFPAGLPVAEIIHIDVLKEGSYSYDFEAKPIVSNIDELTYLFVIPPIGFNTNEI